MLQVRRPPQQLLAANLGGRRRLTERAAAAAPFALAEPIEVQRLHGGVEGTPWRRPLTCAARLGLGVEARLGLARFLVAVGAVPICAMPARGAVAAQGGLPIAAAAAVPAACRVRVEPPLEGTRYLLIVGGIIAA